ncbi:hypothetical protein LA080_012318 [Diaporthe eres]|nr:hypothetical protein LA080_012318 [Diaporthe eres]
MVGLLDLPLELREPILVEVILDTTQQPPNDPASAERSEGYEVMRTSGCKAEPWGLVHCRPLQRHAMPLLHVSQQIRDEVIELMPRRLAQRVDDAKLDVLYVEEFSRNLGFCPNLWVTWLSAPFPTNNLNTLHAQIRDFQIPISSSWARLIWHHNVSIGEDCKYWVKPESAEMLLKFLAEFVRSRKGKTSIHKTQRISGSGGSQPANRTIENLVIDIPFDLDQQDSLEARVRCSWCTDTGDNISNNHAHCRIPSGKRAALIFAQSLHKQLLHILETAPTGWRWMSFLRKIFLAIGTIHLKWNDISRAEFFQWKRAAEEERMTAGFTLVKPSVQEHELVGSAGIIASMLSARGESLVREVTTSSEDVAPSGRQPAANEAVAFSGKAIWVQEDGSALPGNATFYQHTNMGPWWGGFSWIVHPADYRHEIEYQEEYIEERSRDGELILFTGEAILFWADNIEGTIISGEATFYCQGEEGSME